MTTSTLNAVNCRWSGIYERGVCRIGNDEGSPTEVDFHYFSGEKAFTAGTTSPGRMKIPWGCKQGDAQLTS
jgi:hypothetical protein